MKDAPKLVYLHTFSLKHNGDCSLLGVTPDFNIYVEETYTPDAWIAQHQLSLDGTYVVSVDEENGANTQVKPLEIPADVVRPTRGWQTMSLNFSGPRHRGMREDERVMEVVKPLPIATKMMLAHQFNIQSPVLGIAESYVLAEIELIRPRLYIVCRRIRLAFALPEIQTNDSGHSYDYDTQVIYLAHFHQRNHEGDSLLGDAFQKIEGVQLNRPMDCLMCNDHIFIADGGDEVHNSAIHIWQVERDLKENKDT